MPKKKPAPTDEAWPPQVILEVVAWLGNDNDHRTAGDIRAWLRARGHLPPTPPNPDGVSPATMIGRPSEHRVTTESGGQ